MVSAGKTSDGAVRAKSGAAVMMARSRGNDGDSGERRAGGKAEIGLVHLFAHYPAKDPTNTQITR